MTMKASLILELTEQITGPLKKARHAVEGFGEVVDKAKKKGAALKDVMDDSFLVRTAQSANKAAKSVYRVVTAEEQLIKVRKRLSKVREGVGGAWKATKSIGTKGLAAGAIATASLMNFNATAAEFETLAVTLESIQGSAAGGKEALAWVNDFAANTPLQLQGVTDGFIKLKSFGLDPMDGTYQSLVDANSKLGGDQEKLGGIVAAVGQAWAKQKLQGEEILQLVERGVPVWDMLAKVTGKNTAELAEMSSKGKLGRETIKALIDEMGRAADGSAAAQMSTWNGMVSNASDQWSRFQNIVMEAGAFDKMKDVLGDIMFEVEWLSRTGELQEWAVKLSNGFERFIDAGVDTVTTLYEVGSEIFDTMNTVAEFVGGWDNLLIGLAAVGTLSAVSSAIVGIASAMALVISPIGLVVVGIGALVAAGWWLYNNWDDAGEKIEGVWKRLNETAQKNNPAANLGHEWGKSLRESLGSWDSSDLGSFKLGESLGKSLRESIVNWDISTLGTFQLGEEIGRSIREGWESLSGYSPLTHIAAQVQNDGLSIKSVMFGLVDWFDYSTASMRQTLIDSLGFDPFEPISQAATDLINYLSSIDLGAIGVHLMQGLIGGIKSKIDAVGNTIKSVATKIKSVFTGETEIHSPSRLTHGYGDFLMQGLDGGIDQAKDLPIQRMQEVAMLVKGVSFVANQPDFDQPNVFGLENAKLADTSNIPVNPINIPDVIISQAAASQQPTVITNNYNITINAAPGMDENAVARMLVQQIEIHDRKKASQQRVQADSILYDKAG